MSKGGLAVQVIACHVVCHVMEENQIQKFLVGIENKNFYDPRRAMAIRAWFNDDLKLASVLLNYLN